MIFTRMPSHCRQAMRMSSMRLGVHEIGRQRIAEQIGDGHLRMAVLHRAPHVAHGIARQHAHEHRAGRLAPARARRRTGTCAASAKVSSGSSTKLE